MGLPLAAVLSPYHDIAMERRAGVYDIRLVGGTSEMDRDFVLTWRPVTGSVPTAALFTEQVDGEYFGLLMVIPPAEDRAGPAPSREIVIVIDTSGSMGGVSIEQARASVSRALQRLSPTDRFNIIEFNSVSNALYSSSVMASPSNVSNAMNFVQQLKANGGTEMHPALSLALRGRPPATHLRQVVFVTDGSVGNEDELFTMIEQNLGDARLFTVGIGSAPNSWFMRKAAEAGRGSYTFISALHEVGEKMDSLFRKLANPQVTSIEVQWPSSVVVDSYPATVPDLYFGEPVTVRARASGGYRAGDMVRVSGNSVTGAWSKALAFDMSRQSAGIAALWARARIAELMDSERRGGGSGEVRDAIVETALTHHLVSKYTSLVAVDKTPARPAGDPLASEQVANLMTYGHSTNAIFGFPATATDAPMKRVIGLALLLAATLLAVALRAGDEWTRVRLA